MLVLVKDMGHFDELEKVVLTCAWWTYLDNATARILPTYDKLLVAAAAFYLSARELY